MKSRYFVPILIAVFFISVAPVFAADEVTQLQDQITARKKHIDELQRQIDALKQSLQQKQLEKVSLQNQISLINTRLERTKLDIKQTQEQLQETQLQLEQTDLKIKDKEDLITQEQTEIRELVRLIDHADRQSLVQLLASGRTLSDFFTTKDAYTTLNTRLTDAVLTVQKLKAALEEERANYAQLQHELQQTQDKLTSRQSGLESQSAAKAQLLLQTKQSEQKFQQLVASLKREYAATEGEIESIERKVRDRLAQKGGKGLPIGDVHLQWPVPSHIVTASFHDPDYPFRHIFEHPGTDIKAPQGTPVRAAGPGIVARAKNAGMGYSYVMLIHNNKISTVYGHLSRIVVGEDDPVQAGDIIGYSGGTPGTPGAGPFVTGPHLHFEVRLDGIPVNPLDYLP